MAITTYAELQAAIADWLNRSDLTSAIPNFIALAEAEINRRLRTADMEARATVNVSDRCITLPPRWRGARRIFTTVSGVTRELDILSPDQAVEFAAKHSTAGSPLAIAVIGQSLEILPVPDGTYTLEMLYYQGVTPLSNSATTNWLLTKHPDLYLYGSLMHSAPYLRDDPRAAMWATKFDNTIREINLESERASYPTSKLRMRHTAIG